MALTSNATPLIALDAVVLDTETTGLDPERARVVEMAALAVSGGRIEEARAFRSLVRPGVAIPPDATAIHGIDDSAVLSAPVFADVWPQLQGFVGDSVVIGHTVGFDLAVIRHECERAGLVWRRPRSLDTRLLAELAVPDLAGFSLDHLAAWLGVEPAGRHSAAGDARTAAAIFVALLPKLRERGIRTLAEAERACRSLTGRLDDQHRAGWVEPVAPYEDPRRLVDRIDTNPFRNRVADVMSAPLHSIGGDATVAAALRLMARHRISSLIVAGAAAEAGPDGCGIVTERDLLRAIAEAGADALTRPVDRIASRPLVAISADDFVYRAAGRMSALNSRHLAVVDQNGGLCGMVSARDLLRLGARGALALGDEIDRAADVPALARAWAKLPPTIANLHAEGLGGREVAAVISHELAALTRAAAVLAERRRLAEGHGRPPSRYAVAVLGSAGRGESLLALDQDNALIFEDGEPGSETDRWFAALADIMTAILHEVGVPYCKGGVMATNPAWRGSVATWRARVAGWIRSSDPRDLLCVDIFFDLCGVHGTIALATGLWREAFDAAQGDAGFAKLLADAGGTVERGLTMFGRFRTDQGRIDLKKTGLFGIVTAARVLAIRHHVVERATAARLAGLLARGSGAADDLAGLAEAHGVFLDLLVPQQLDDLDHGRPPTNAVAVQRLSVSERRKLRAALQQVRHLDALVRDLLFADEGAALSPGNGR